MKIIEHWTGADARLLREAMRLSVHDFAARLGRGQRTVAEARADHAPVAVVPELICGKAQALALIGDKREAARSLREAHKAFAVLPASVTTSSADSLFAWGEERLRFAESFVYSHLGDYPKAVNAQAAALKLYPDHDIRGPAQIELHRALCLVRTGDVEQGAQHAPGRYWWTAFDARHSPDSEPRAESTESDTSTRHEQSRSN